MRSVGSHSTLGREKERNNKRTGSDDNLPSRLTVKAREIDLWDPGFDSRFVIFLLMEFSHGAALLSH